MTPKPVFVEVQEEAEGGEPVAEQDARSTFAARIEELRCDLQRANAEFEAAISDIFVRVRELFRTTSPSSYNAAPGLTGIWYDYTHQAWVVNGKYQDCGHPESMNCDCYGRAHAGEVANTQYRQA